MHRSLCSAEKGATVHELNSFKHTEMKRGSRRSGGSSNTARRRREEAEGAATQSSWRFLGVSPPISTESSVLLLCCTLAVACVLQA